MKNNAKNRKISISGFTLVEVIAIIAVLGVIIILILPSIKSTSDNRKQVQYENIVKTIENAGKRYLTYNEDDNVVFLSTLQQENYVISNMINPIDNTQISGCVAVIKDENGFNTYKYMDDNVRCRNFSGEHLLIIDYNDGSEAIQHWLKVGETLQIQEPTRAEYLFINWTLIGEDSNISDDVFTMGSEDATLTANWQMYPKLIVNLAGGSTTQIFNEIYPSGTTITLTTPTKTGYIFLGWTVTGTGSGLDGNVLTIGSEDTRLTAHWIDPGFYPVNSYSCKNGSVGSGQ